MAEKPDDSIDLEEFPYVEPDAGSIIIEQEDVADELTLHELLTLLDGKQQ